MKTLLIVAFVLFLAETANAGIPRLNYTCPGSIEVHADEGGPVYINGKETELKKFNENYFEATGSDVTISISINPDGSPSVSYTGKHRAHGICQNSQAGGSSTGGATSISETGSEGERRESRRHDEERRRGEGESRRITCESKGGKYDYCRTHTTGKVELRKQLSDAACREYDTWGTDGDGSGIWVREGCRAEFVVSEHHWSRRSGDDHHHGDHGKTFTCKSEHYAYNHCSVPGGMARGVELVRQISKASCERGSNWGEDSRGIWVMNGCEGEFRARE